MSRIIRAALALSVGLGGIGVLQVASAPPAEAACGRLTQVTSGVHKGWWTYSNCTSSSQKFVASGGGYDVPTTIVFAPRTTRLFDMYVNLVPYSSAG